MLLNDRRLQEKIKYSDDIPQKEKIVEQLRKNEYTMINNQEEGAKKMGATRDLFKAEFEERDNKIAELTKEVESNKKELESQKSFI